MVANLEQGRGKCSLLNSPKPLLCIVCTSIFNKIYCDSHLERDRRIRLIYEFIYTGFVQKYGNAFNFIHFVKYLPKYLMDISWTLWVQKIVSVHIVSMETLSQEHNKNWKEKKQLFGSPCIKYCLKLSKNLFITCFKNVFVTLT